MPQYVLAHRHSVADGCSPVTERCEELFISRRSADALSCFCRCWAASACLRSERKVWEKTEYSSSQVASSASKNADWPVCAPKWLRLVLAIDWVLLLPLRFYSPLARVHACTCVCACGSHRTFCMSDHKSSPRLRDELQQKIYLKINKTAKTPLVFFFFSIHMCLCACSPTSPQLLQCTVTILLTNSARMSWTCFWRRDVQFPVVLFLHNRLNKNT